LAMCIFSLYSIEFFAFCPFPSEILLGIHSEIFIWIKLDD
jgi:hypothetical protein